MTGAVHVLRMPCAVALAQGDGTLVSNNKVWSDLWPVYQVNPLLECICTIE